MRISKKRVWGLPWLVREEWTHGVRYRIGGMTFQFGHRELEDRLAALEKRLIVESGWWDPLWYVRTYGHDFTRSEALDYWYSTGWRKGEDPGPRFSLAKCPLDACGDENPLVAYLNRRVMFFTAAGNVHRSQDDDARVASYWKRHGGRRAKGVVYTCVTGGYDDIGEIAVPGYVSDDWDYVCFTDDAALARRERLGVWQMRPLAFSELDLTRNNRWHKMHPHVLFPDCDASIYIDANVNVLSRRIFDWVESSDRSFLLPRHFANLCVYREYDNVLKGKIDDAQTVLRERRILEESGMPHNYGLCENNVLFRRHNDGEIVALDEEWWAMVRDHSKRDQLSLVWLFWKRGWRVEEMTFENVRLLSDDFLVFAHKGGKK